MRLAISLCLLSCCRHGGGLTALVCIVICEGADGVGDAVGDAVGDVRMDLTRGRVGWVMGWVTLWVMLGLWWVASAEGGSCSCPTHVHTVILVTVTTVTGIMSTNERLQRCGE